MTEQIRQFAAAACTAPDRTGRVFRMTEIGKNRPLRIMAFGGSVTFGYTTGANITAYPSLLCDMLPCETVLNNLAAAGTNAWLGLYLAAREAELFAPDLVLVEYAVNQEATAELTGAYESLLYRLLTLPSSPAVIAVMCTNEQHVSSEAVLTKVALHYGLPVISVRAGLGDIPWEAYACDAVHPNTNGQTMLAHAVYTAIMQAEPVEGYTLPDKPLLNRDAASLRLYDLGSSSGGLREYITFLALFDAQKAVILQGESDTFILEAEGKAFLLVFRQSCYADTDNAQITIDNDAPVTLYASCMNGWGNPFVQRIIPKTKSLRHKLRIKKERGDGRFILWGIAAL